MDGVLIHSILRAIESLWLTQPFKYPKDIAFTLYLLNSRLFRRELAPQVVDHSAQASLAKLIAVHVLLPMRKVPTQNE